MKDNAIYHLAEGLVAPLQIQFSIQAERNHRGAYFERIAQFEGEQTATDIRAMLSDRPDPAALSFVPARGQSGL